MYKCRELMNSCITLVDIRKIKKYDDLLIFQIYFLSYCLLDTKQVLIRFLPILFFLKNLNVMKKAFTFFAMCYALLTQAQTPIYHPMPDSNAQWNFQKTIGLCWNPVLQMQGYMTYNYTVYLNGDTTINNQAYHKVFSSGVQYVSIQNCEPLASWHSYDGAIREDTTAKKVYFLFILLNFLLCIKLLKIV